MTIQQSSTHVGVHVTSCTREDADAVFRALEDAFPVPLDWQPGEPLAQACRTGNPTVWSMTFDARARGEAAQPGELAGPVIVDLFGTDGPVARVRGVLVELFDVESQLLVSGDQEMEARLRLTPHPDR